MAALKNRKEKLINLLPKDKLSETTLGRALIWFLSTFRILVIITELLVISAFLSRFWLDAKNSDLSEEIRQKEAQISAMKSTEERVRTLQKKVEIINYALSTQRKPSRIINTLTQQTPPDIILSSIKLAESKITISGTSTNEIAINQLLVNLRSIAEFENTTITQLGQSEDATRTIKFALEAPLGKETK